MKTRHQKGYTLIETMVAISLLMFSVAAAAALSHAMIRQEEMNIRVSRALNWQENAVRLYSLGIGSSSNVTPIENLMPVLPEIAAALSASSTTTTFSGVPGTIDVVTINLQYYTKPDGSVIRSSDMKVVR